MAIAQIQLTCCIIQYRHMGLEPSEVTVINIDINMVIFPDLRNNTEKDLNCLRQRSGGLKFSKTNIILFYA